MKAGRLMARAAMENERTTRTRVETIEKFLEEMYGRGFWRRMRWLFLGR